jgi:hypothetical protein
MLREPRALALAAAIAVVAPAAAAVAGDWEIEFHGGGRWTLTPSSGQATSPLGAGIVSTSGEEASATLAGGYRFASPAGESEAPFDETDTVTVRSSGTSFVGVAGVGWKQDLSARWGLRFDARAYLSGNPARIVLDAGPSVTKGSPASAYVASSSIGAIQFVNDGSGPYEGQQSSLSGPAIAGLETFSGTGILTQVNVTLGVFLRF